MRPTPLPALQDNYVWTLGERRALVVDPGQAAPVLAAAGRGLEPAAILLTHHHDDHCAGVPELLDRWPGLPVIAPEDPRIAGATGHARDGDTLEVAGHSVRVIAVPGHTRSHVAYLVDGVLFSGDALFSMGCGRMFEGDAAQMHGSLQRLAALPGTTLVCCGHEYTVANGTFALAVEPDNAALAARQAEARLQRQAGKATVPVALDTERATNPFLRCGEATVQSAAARRLGHAPRDEAECFGALRAWKDGFGA